MAPSSFQLPAISTFSLQDETESLKRKLRETIVNQYKNRLLKQIIFREEEVPILGTIKTLGLLKTLIPMI